MSVIDKHSPGLSRHPVTKKVVGNPPLFGGFPTTLGRVVGVEVKLAKTVDQKAFKGLKELQEALGSSFHRGIVLYTGDKPVSFSKNLSAVPIQALWS